MILVLPSMAAMEEDCKDYKEQLCRLQLELGINMVEEETRLRLVLPPLIMVGEEVTLREPLDRAELLLMLDIPMGVEAAGSAVELLPQMEEQVEVLDMFIPVLHLDIILLEIY